MTIHTIEPERATLHGQFSRDLPPILTIAPGDTVRYRTLDAGWNLEPRTSPVPAERPRKFAPRDPVRDKGHANCGPIAIAGAEPGMTLAVHINTVRPATWGWTSAGGWSSTVNERLGIATGEERMLLWTLDPEERTGRNQYGQIVALRPFLGVMGVAPADPGWHSDFPPAPWGGNVDCKELVAGSTLYLPIFVPGALFSLGDGHAAQGDGEVSSTAIECPMDLVEVTFELLPDQHLTAPRANTPAGWITLGFHPDLHEAAMLALEQMLDLLGERCGLERREALALASVCVDLHVTQLVNAGVLGVHAILPHDALCQDAPSA